MGMVGVGWWGMGKRGLGLDDIDSVVLLIHNSYGGAIFFSTNLHPHHYNSI